MSGLLPYNILQVIGKHLTYAIASNCWNPLTTMTIDYLNNFLPDSPPSIGIPPYIHGNIPRVPISMEIFP
jgi:hypothetical protein